MLQEEVSIINTPGWRRRLSWIAVLFQEDSKNLSFGRISDDRLRMQAEGRCQAFKMLLDRDDEIVNALEALRKEAEEQDAPEVLEGGDFGISYEGAQ